MKTYPAELQKVEKSKIVDVDSLFALDASTQDDTSSKGPISSVFFDSVAPAGRASRFRQLFAQNSAPRPLPPENRPTIDRTTSTPAFAAMNKPSSSAEDREGFQRIMAMLGGGGGGGPNLNRPAVRSYSTSLTCSSMINRRQYNSLRRYHPCKTTQFITNPRASSFSDYCDKVNPWEATHPQLFRVSL